MNRSGYTVLGWLVWNGASWYARRKVRANRGKLGAVAVIALVLIGGVLAAKAETDS